MLTQDFSMSSEHLEPLEDEDSNLDQSWSLSGISQVSGMDPVEQITKTVNGSQIMTPDITDHLENDDLSRLASNVEDLRKSLATIREKTVTPLNSPRPPDRNESTPNTIQKKPQKIAQTPPVKDSGPGEYNLEHMRKVLKNLEQSQLNRRPVRSLMFGEDRDNEKHQIPLKKSFGEVENDTNGFLDRLKSTIAADLDQGSKGVGIHMLEELKQQNSQEYESIRIQLREEKEKNYALENQSQTYIQQLRTQDGEIQKLKESIGRKDELLSEIKSKWFETTSRWNSEKEKLAEELKSARMQSTELSDALHRQKLEHQEIKVQFNICQKELEKALILATRFKEDMDQQEEKNNLLLDQIRIEHKDRANEKASLEKLENENKKLIKDLEKLSLDLRDSEDKQDRLEQEKNELETFLNTEREQFNLDRSRLKADVDEQRKKNEEFLHDFYLKQLDAIVGEKVAALQNHVKDWEKKLNEEKAAALNNMKVEHRLQIEALRRQFAQLEAQIKASEAVHIASRREAEALKTKLERPPAGTPECDQGFAHSATTTTTTTTSDEDTLRPNSILNNRQRPPFVRKSRMSSVTVMNDLHPQIPELEIRPRSASAAISLPASHNSFALTSPEKKDMVQMFIKQFFEDNPIAVFDTRLMAQLSERANELINPTFPEDHSHHTTH